MHQVVDLLTPLRAAGGGRLTRLNVRVQLALALTTILAVAVSTQAWLPALVVFGSLARWPSCACRREACWAGWPDRWDSRWWSASCGPSPAARLPGFR